MAVGSGAVEPAVRAPRDVSTRRSDDHAPFGLELDSVAEHDRRDGSIAHLEPEVLAAAAGEGHDGVGQRPVPCLELVERPVAVVARIDVDDGEARHHPGHDADVGVGPASPPGAHLPGGSRLGHERSPPDPRMLAGGRAAVAAAGTSSVDDAVNGNDGPSAPRGGEGGGGGPGGVHERAGQPSSFRLTSSGTAPAAGSMSGVIETAPSRAAWTSVPSSGANGTSLPLKSCTYVPGPSGRNSRS